MPSLSPERQDALLQELHIVVLAVARWEGSPLATPIWYEYRDGLLWMDTDVETLHGKLLRARGRATLVVQDERPPYRYVSMEGPVAFHGKDLEVARRISARYMGVKGAEAHLRGVRAQYQPYAEAVSLRPDQTWAAWFPVD